MRELYELLSNGTAARPVQAPARKKHADYGPAKAFVIHTVVAAETLVLNGDKGILHMVWNGVDGDDLPPLSTLEVLVEIAIDIHDAGVFDVIKVVGVKGWRLGIEHTKGSAAACER